MTDKFENDGLNPIQVAVDTAEEFVDTLGEVLNKPRLLIEPANPDRSVAALRDILSTAGDLYDRGVPVRLAHDQIRGGTVAQVMTPEVLVLTAHKVCRPYELRENRDGSIDEKNVRLPRYLALMYLEWRSEWNLPPLNGIASAPMLTENGAIHCKEDYDPKTGMWCENVPDLSDLVPDKPKEADATVALRLLRETFKTFCFADAKTYLDPTSGLELVDTNTSPGRDETDFLAALLTAVCRPSLHLAPGVLLRAAPMSGAGAGKGLLARCISTIAFGREPHAVTGGGAAAELEKRIASELIEGSPVLFLDNLNNFAFKSDLLASAITERPARVRILGKSQMLPLNASAFVVLTGNGLTVSEDLARRFIAIDFDPHTEDPEARNFTTDIRAEVTNRRTELLAAVLTIWRWGRQHGSLPTGRALGSFEQWCRWVRDPLLALGCQDPADRVSEAKERDNRRQVIAEFFNLWWERHGERAMTIRDLDEEVCRVIDPQDRGRQFLSSQLQKLTGTRMAGFVLTRQTAAGKWGAATYALEKTENQGSHRDHRGHGETVKTVHPSDAPYAPDADHEPEKSGEDARVSSSSMPLTPPVTSAGPEPSTSIDTNQPRWRRRI